MNQKQLSEVRRAAGRKGGLKGGKAKVKKGFANRELASKAGKISAQKRLERANAVLRERNDNPATEI